MNFRENITEQINENDVKFVKLQFVDLFGELKNISITSGQIEKALDGKMMVDGFHISGMHELGHDRVFLRPDVTTFAILPWRPQHGKVARLLCDLTDENGNALAESPRSILKRVLQEAAQQGFSFDINPDCEFFLFPKDENGHVTTHTEEIAGYLDVAPIDKGENARRDLILALEEMGFEIESSRHEVANGQHSVLFRHSGGIRLADQIVTFRTTIRTVAERHGLHATFMPKPRTDLPGSAMKLSICVFKDGKNIFDSDPEMASSFIGGILEHTFGMAAFSNPVINSYKRLMYGYCAPTRLYWSTTDRYAPIRFVKNSDGDPCINWNLPDGAADPYMILAALILSGLDGINRKLPAGEANENIRPLPFTLLDSLRALEKDEYLNEKLGQNFVKAYIHEKEKEWERYSKEVTDWELKEYLRRI